MELPVWCYLSSSHPWLELPASVGIRSFASNQAAFFSLSSKNPGDWGGEKPGRYLKSEQWTPWHIFKYYFFNQQGHSHLFTCLHQGPVPWQPKQLFCQGENHLGRNKFLFALQKGGFTFCPRANIMQLNNSNLIKSSFTLFRINHRHPFSSSLPSFNFPWCLRWAKCFFQQKVSEEVSLQFQKRHSLEISFVESNCIPHPLLWFRCLMSAKVQGIDFLISASPCRLHVRITRKF